MKKKLGFILAFALVMMVSIFVLAFCGKKVKDEGNGKKESQGLAFQLVNNEYYIVTNIGICTDTKIYIPEKCNGLPVKEIGLGAFANCSKLKSVTIPDSVTSIGDSAFYGCESLTSIVIPDSVTSIGEWAFLGCESLTSIVIPDSVTSIGDRAFLGCESLTSIVIPDSVTNIGDLAFFGCTSLTSIKVDENNVKYKDIDGNLYTKTGITLIQYAIGKPDASFAIPKGVAVINSDAFRGCKNLTSVIITKRVTSIGNYAFKDCSNLVSIKYCGTEAQWYAITKGSAWDSGAGSYTITYNYNGN